MRYGVNTCGVWTLKASAVLLLLLACACDGRRAPSRRDARNARDEADAAPYQAEVEEGLGAAVAILVDTSGSMKDSAPGDDRPKYVVAQEAIEAMLDATDAFVAKRPDFPIKIGLYSFSSSVRTLRSIQPYDRAAIRRRWTACRGPAAARRSARRCARRGRISTAPACSASTLLVVTDGENTSGRDPGRRGARDLRARARAPCRSISSRSTRAPRSSRS